MATKILNIYTTLNLQGILVKAVATLKYAPLPTLNSAGSLTSVVNEDLVGLSTGNIATLMTTLNSAGALYDYVNICVPSQTSTATNKLTYDQIAKLDAILKTGSQGAVNNIVIAGATQTNSTNTNIVLDSGASTVTDAYKGKYIVTGGGVYRYITGYDGSTKICTVVSTGTAITSADTYTIYSSPNINIIGDASSNQTACRVAWTTLFPTVNIPVIISMNGGYGSGFQPHIMVTQTATSAAAATLTHTANFTANAYASGTFYVAIESATTGAGQVKRIISNTANVLTIEPWDVVPTGSIVYQICSGPEFVLYEKYLPYAIRTYLATDVAKTNKDFQQLMDQLNTIPNGDTHPQYNKTLLHSYAQKGKAVFDAVCAGLVS
jgi:hypothetical protein